MEILSYDEIIAWDKTSLDITWLKDKSLPDRDNLPDRDELALEIVENLEANLESFYGDNLIIEPELVALRSFPASSFLLTLVIRNQLDGVILRNHYQASISLKKTRQMRIKIRVEKTQECGLNVDY